MTELFAVTSYYEFWRCIKCRHTKGCSSSLLLCAIVNITNFGVASCRHKEGCSSSLFLCAIVNIKNFGVVSSVGIKRVVPHLSFSVQLSILRNLALYQVSA